MEKEILTKEIAKKLMEVEGEGRGVALKGQLEFVLKEKGEEGLKEIEEEMARVDCPIKYREIRAMEFYPVGWEAVNLLAMKKLFNFQEEDFKRMAEFESKTSLVMRVFLKYLFSIDKMVKEVPQIWKKNYTKGNLRLIDFKEEEKRVILRLEDFSLHPIHCFCLKSYIASIMKMMLKKDVSSKEIKCTFWGDEYHEFIFRWE